MNYRILLDIALILFTTKVLGILMNKIGLPQVLGALIAGVLLGVIGIVKGSDNLTVLATIGVNLIMFSAGMETNFKEIRRNGVASVLITSLGVIVPLIFGFGVSWIIPGLTIKQRFFFGVILTATSVGITVATLKELGVLHGKVGASIVTAAILDDIIGIVILAFFTASGSAKTLGARIILACKGDIVALSGVAVLINVFLFFVVGISAGILIHFLFKQLGKRFPGTRRLSIFGLVSCFVYAWAAETMFGVAAITGSFLAGMMLSNMQQSQYVERRIDMSAYMLFSPIFFANIGITLPYSELANNFTPLIVGFSIAFVVVGLLGKFLGCGLGAAICKYKKNQCVKVGVGMMVRGEVCLIVAQAGVNAGIMSATYFPAIIMLIIVSSILTPVILKVMFHKFPNELLDESKEGSLATVEKEQNKMEGMPEVIVEQIIVNEAGEKIGEKVVDVQVRDNKEASQNIDEDLGD